MIASVTSTPSKSPFRGLHAKTAEAFFFSAGLDFWRDAVERTPFAISVRRVTLAVFLYLFKDRKLLFRFLHGLPDVIDHEIWKAMLFRDFEFFVQFFNRCHCVSPFFASLRENLVNFFATARAASPSGAFSHYPVKFRVHGF